MHTETMQCKNHVLLDSNSGNSVSTYSHVKTVRHEVPSNYTLIFFSSAPHKATATDEKKCPSDKEDHQKLRE